MSTALANTETEPEEYFRYLVTYELTHVHRVTVGMRGPDEEAVEDKARDLFFEGRFWDNTDEVPLLSDAWEEEDQGLEFEVRKLEAGEAWPEPDYSIGVKKAEQAAYEVAERLIDLFRKSKVGEMPAELRPLYELALKACPRKTTQQEG